MIIENAHVDMHLSENGVLSVTSRGARHQLHSRWEISQQDFHFLFLPSIGSIFYCHLLDDNFKLSILVHLRP